MKIRRKRKKEMNSFDPLGSWTGVAKDPHDEPEQDADDL